MPRAAKRARRDCAAWSTRTARNRCCARRARSARVVEHGGLANAEALKALADGGVYFDPNIGLVTQNYLENKARFLGIGNYTEEGFASMEKALGLRGPMFTTALKTPGLKIVMGTDAVAGAHGQNAREPIERVKTGQKPMDAIVGMTSLAAAVDGPRQGARRDRGRPQRRSRRRRGRSAAGHHRAAARAVRHAKWKGVQSDE